MAYLTLDRRKLQANFDHLETLFGAHGIDWGITTKLLCGNRLFLNEVIRLGRLELLDSRMSNLRVIKELAPDAQTVYIKPPSGAVIPDLVRWADVSFNTELSTIRAISEEAVRQGREHLIIIMIEMGDLREGVLRDEIVDFYEQVFRLPNIRIIGIGTNLNCLNGVMPSEDKLIQLGLYRTIIELKNDVKIQWVSAGTTVTIPLLLSGALPAAINHFRIGEALFFGQDLVAEGTFAGMHDDVLELHAQVIELAEKPTVPSGVLGRNPFGQTAGTDDGGPDTTHRAILDVGYLDISPQYLSPVDDRLEVVGGSSDMLVLNVGQNEAGLQVGSYVTFRLKYMGALHLMNSPYIDKFVLDGSGRRIPESAAPGQDAAQDGAARDVPPAAGDPVGADPDSG
ncbi:alanine racemase [Deinococcus seoulensis]|uniref:Alanine racemase n=1 Tax=Deinococcus seoulensis TaxID=1837379 RepID=A0ABQ2RTD9_9DEIO|nr:alanine racemase [Deinococcus seoulensis]GGR64884.1 alanine racemase [Deinococcus seoulensis]